jgi:hypothetical protein
MESGKQPQVFISYAREDEGTARKLYADLQRAGVRPWMDKENLLPGQHWKTAIQQAIRQSDYVIVLLSSRSVSKRAYVQKEVRAALEELENIPVADIYVIPARVDDCEVPYERLQDLHWVDLFPSYADGLAKIFLAMEIRPPLPPPSFFRKPVRIVLAALVLVSVLLLGGMLFNNSSIRPFFFRPTPTPTPTSTPQPTATQTPTATPALTATPHILGFTLTPTRPPTATLTETPKPTPLPTAAPTPEPTPTPTLTPEPTPTPTPTIPLRSEPKTVSAEDAQKEFELTTRQMEWGETNPVPRTYIENQYEVQGDVVVDHATGLMWQKSGSENEMTYGEAQEYVKKLNQKKFAGYSDWRLPTIPELMSLLEPEKQKNGLYMSPIFGVKEKYYWYWSADRLPESEGGSSGGAWGVHFADGGVAWNFLDNKTAVRCVRSISLWSEPEIVISAPTRTVTPTPMRSELEKVSTEEAQKEFKLTTNWVPRTYVENQYEVQGDVVVDHATGLMWQKSGSESYMTYGEAQEYVKKLNQEQFAGYDDWRLPTIPELMSLLEPEKQSNNLYIDPIFDSKQIWCWSADRLSSGAAWPVYFRSGYVGWGDSLHGTYYVRCVRSRQRT